LVIAFAAAPSQAAGVRQLLIVQSLDRGSQVFDRITDTFHQTLEARASGPVTIAQFVLAPPGFSDAPEQATIDFLRKAFVGRSAPDLIVTIGGSAAAFVRKFRHDLFPRTPVVFAATDPRFLGDAVLADTETAVTTVIEHSRLVDDILRLRPETTDLFVVTGAGPLGKYWRDELEREFQRFRDRLTFTWTDTWTYAQVLDRASHLPSHSAVLFVTAGTDAQGGWRSSDATLADLASRANAPLFGAQSAWLGTGIVGGTLMFNEDLGAVAADVALRILQGESPGSIRMPPRTLGPAAFDARQLRRWNIPETRLPAGSIVRFREPSLWQQHRSTVIAGTTIGVLQLTLIVALLYQRQARRVADRRARQQLTIAAHLERQLAMGELAAALAHELNQPLGAIRLNVSAASRLLASNHVSTDDLREILQDIDRDDARASQIIQRQRAMLQKREVERRPLDLNSVVRESLAIVAHHAESNHVQVDAALCPEFCVVKGDQITLQQVLVNLVINGIDAMTSIPASERRLVVSTTATPYVIEVSVQDCGEGIAPDLMARLFDPFVTTKTSGMGIGLSIARSIVEAHGGTIQARNNGGSGATFWITLPALHAGLDNGTPVTEQTREANTFEGRVATSAEGPS
jgi:signal transduction histidine kinase